MTATHICLTVSLWLYTFQIPYYGLLATTARGCEFLAGSCGRFFGYTIILFLLFYHEAHSMNDFM